MLSCIVLLLVFLFIFVELHFCIFAPLLCTAMHQRVAAIKIQPSIPFLDLSAKQKHRRIFLGFDLEGQFSEPIFPRLRFLFGPGLVLWGGG